MNAHIHWDTPYVNQSVVSNNELFAQIKLGMSQINIIW